MDGGVALMKQRLVLLRALLLCTGFTYQWRAERTGSEMNRSLVMPSLCPPQCEVAACVWVGCSFLQWRVPRTHSPSLDDKRQPHVLFLHIPTLVRRIETGSSDPGWASTAPAAANHPQPKFVTQVR
jgi:hypothetical protein